jgi:hypothetical protein
MEHLSKEENKTEEQREARRMGERIQGDGG